MGWLPTAGLLYEHQSYCTGLGSGDSSSLESGWLCPLSVDIAIGILQPWAMASIIASVPVVARLLALKAWQLSGSILGTEVITLSVCLSICLSPRCCCPGSGYFCLFTTFGRGSAILQLWPLCPFCNLVCKLLRPISSSDVQQPTSLPLLRFSLPGLLSSVFPLLSF